MPSNSAPPKILASRAYGAHITFCDPTSIARSTTCAKVQRETGAVFVPPYDSVRTILGQGTIWLEIERQVREMGWGLEELGAVVVPVGGGGLLAGVCLAVEGKIPVFGAEPKGADDCARGVRSGERVKDLVPETIADGLRTPVGEFNFPIIKQHVRGIITVSEEVRSVTPLSLSSLARTDLAPQPFEKTVHTPGNHHLPTTPLRTPKNGGRTLRRRLLRRGSFGGISSPRDRRSRGDDHQWGKFGS